MFEDDIAKNLDLWIDLIDTELEMEQKFNQCKLLPKNDQLLYMKDAVLKHHEISNELFRIGREALSSMNFSDFVTAIGRKSVNIYQEKFEIIFENFNENLGLVDLLGKKKEEVINEEALKWLAIFNDQKNIVLARLGKEPMDLIMPKVESYLNMLNINQNSKPNLNDTFNKFISPTPNHLSEEELSQDLPLNDDKKFEDIVKKIEKSNEKFKLLLKSTAKELVLLNCQKSYFEKVMALKNNPEPEELVHKNGKEFTLNRQVLVFYYLFNALNVKQIDTAEKARFVQFLTGRELGAKTIKNTNIYKLMKQPFKDIHSEKKKDLRFIKDYFKRLELTAIVDEIIMEIDR